MSAELPYILRRRPAPASRNAFVTPVSPNESKRLSATSTNALSETLLTTALTRIFCPSAAGMLKLSLSSAVFHCRGAFRSFVFAINVGVGNSAG